MRDKLIHDYFGIDLETVWDTVQEDLLPLKIAVESLLEKLSYFPAYATHQTGS